MSAIHKPATKITATGTISLCAGDEVLESNTVVVSWVDSELTSYYRDSMLIKICKQHLVTKSMRLYRQRIKEDQGLIARINGRRTKIVVTDVIPQVEKVLQPLDGGCEQAMRPKLLSEAVDSLVKDFGTLVKEFQDMKKFLKKNYGESKATQAYLERKKKIHSDIGKICKNYGV